MKKLLISILALICVGLRAQNAAITSGSNLVVSDGKMVVYDLTDTIANFGTSTQSGAIDQITTIFNITPGYNVYVDWNDGDGGHLIVADGTDKSMTSGLPDATFNTGTGLDDFPRDIKILENGNLMVAGVFENYKGSAAPGAFEVTTLGTVVSTFNIGTGFTAGSGWQLGVHGFAEYNGSIVFAGTWNEFNGNSDSKDLIQLTSGGEVIEPLNFEFKASGSGVSTTGDFSAESVETTGGMTSGGIIGLTDWTVGPDDGTFATEREGFVLRDTSSVFNRRRLNIFDPADEINALDFRIGADGNSGMFRMESWIYPTSQTYASMSVIDYNNTGEAGYYLGADGSSSSIHRWYTRDNDGTASTYLGYNGLYSTHVTPSEWDNTYYITKSYGDTAYAETPHTVYIAGNLLSIVNDTISADSAITAGYEGLPWTTTESSRTWYSTAISNDGKYVTAGYGSGGYLHTSDDYGATWTQRGVSGDYRVMDISSTGQYQTAGSSGSYIYTSNDYGVTWTQRGITGLWRGMGLSSSGQYQTGAIASGYLYTSNDYGVTWTQRDATRDWRDIDVSGTGQLQVAAGNPGVMRYSNDYGVTWSDVSLNYACGAVSMSSNGKYMIAARIFPNESYYSDDYGVTWSEGFEFPENVQSLAMSSSGKYVIATTFGNYVFNSNDYGKTWTQSNYSASWRDGAISDLGKFRVAVGGGTFINLQLSNTTANINAGFIYNSSDKFNINSLEEVNIYSPFINFNDSIVDTIYSGTIPNTDWVNAEIAEAITGGLTFTGGIQEATDIVSLTLGTLLQDFELTGSFDWGFYHAVDNYYHGGVQVTPSTGTVDITSANATWKRMQINSNGLNWRYWEPYLVGSTNRDHNMEIDNAGFDLQLEELGGRGATAWETRMSLGQTNLYIRSFQSGWEGIRLGGLTVSEQEALGDDYVVTKEYVDYTSPIIINVQGLSYNPADGVTRYFGMLPRAPVTTASSNRIYIRENGTLTAAEIFAFSSTAGSAEGWSLYVRLNNTTDYLIATVSAATNERSWTNTSLSVPLVAGDYITIKCVQPTWATNPNGTIFGGYITIK